MFTVAITRIMNLLVCDHLLVKSIILKSKEKHLLFYWITHFLSTDTNNTYNMEYKLTFWVSRNFYHTIQTKEIKWMTSILEIFKHLIEKKLLSSDQFAHDKHKNSQFKI